MNIIKKEDDKHIDHGSSLERTFLNIKHGAQVEPFKDEPRGAGVGTDDDPNAKAFDVKL